ncbi:MAG: DUF1566 domain-containing protein [Desulfobacterales bacterium]
MEEKNFYLLLELSADPPEENPEIIEEAIKTKQALWSKQRNHPTKGTLAQQYIGLIPEIRKVMTDPKLRRQEALKAKKIFLEKEKRAYSKIDRHIGLFMSKGNISKKEIRKISAFHSLEEEKVQKRARQMEPLFRINRKVDEFVSAGKTGDRHAAALAKSLNLEPVKIQEWIAKKISDRDRDIDRYVSRCVRRGYISTSEIGGLARLHAVKEADLLKRIKCPVRKKAGEGEKAKPIEKTIENLISDKLRIVGKNSLYDFLGMSPEENLDELQKRARSKEAEIRRISHKDALTTAGGALAGHCIAIFSSEESRKSYDLSLTMSRISELNTDIDMAESKGRIRPEYMDILLKAAVRLGLDMQEAHEYIEGYCKSKKWTIEKPRVNPKKKRLIILAGLLILVPLIAGIGIYGASRKIKAERIRNAYETALREAEMQPELEGKEVIFGNYLKYYPNTEYTADMEGRLRSIGQQIRERDFRQSDEKARKLAKAGEEEKALEVYRQYLAQHPDTVQAKTAARRMSEIETAIDDRDFDALKSVAGKDHETRIAAYNAYFDKHPRGRHTADVQKLTASMVDEYFRDLKSGLSTCEARQEWEKCISLCDTFIKKFKNTAQADEARGLQKKFRNKIQIRSDLGDMKRKAEAFGTDYEGARLVYLEYLEANPELPSYLKELIVGEIRVLDQKIKDLEQAEREWEETLAYSRRDAADMGDRIRKMEAYLGKYPDSVHVQEAKTILEDLRQRKRAEDERRHQEQEDRAWRTLVSEAGNARKSLSERIRLTEEFVNAHSSGKYIKNARLLLNDLRKQKAIEDERLRSEQANLLRLQREKQRIAALFRQAGSRFADNGNGTVTDRRTGLTWTMFDSAFELNRCLNFPDAQRYVENLNTGGYSGWRLPTVAELSSLFQNRPAYPASSAAKWFWSAETFWHGWNKETYIVTTGGSKEAVSVEKCGAVLAVRK